MSETDTADGHSPEEGAREPRHPIGPGNPPLGFADPAVRAKAEKTRRDNARMRRESPVQAIRQDIVNAVPDLGRMLVAAAKGEKPFETLSPQDRLKALFRALEYGVGRPEAISKVGADPKGEKPDEDEDETEQEGLTFA